MGPAIPRARRAVVALLTAAFVVPIVISPASAQAPNPLRPKPVWSQSVAFDVSRPLSQLAAERVPPADVDFEADDEEDAPRDSGYTGDSALQTSAPTRNPPSTSSFEGMSNQDNFNIFGCRVNPPDPNGEVGPNNYVEMINLVFAVYDKAGNLLLGPVDTGTLWAGFAIPDCTDPSGDPVVLYDQYMDRWLLSPVHYARPRRSGLPFYNCVADLSHP